MNSEALNTLRRVLLGLACTAGLVAAPLFAQDNIPAPQTQQQPSQGGYQGNPEEMQQRQLDHLTKALNLTPDQVNQVKAIQTSNRQQMMALHSDTTLAPADRHAKMMSLHATAQSNIRAVLSDDQKLKFDAMQARMRERREEHKQNQQAPPSTAPSN